jgi:hypothetical protein
MEVRILSVLLVVVGGNIRWPSLQRPPLQAQTGRKIGEIPPSPSLCFAD